MNLIVGSACISGAVFMFCIVILGARNPRKPWWASDMWVGNLFCPVLVGLGLVEITVTITCLYKLAVSGGNLMDLLLSVVILAVTVLGVKAMRVRKKLAAFEKEAPVMPFVSAPAGKEPPTHIPSRHDMAA